MSQLRGKLTTIKKNSALHLLEFKLIAQSIKLLTLELPKFMAVGEFYSLCVKSTDIALAKDFSGTISVLNQLEATILSIRCEEILCSIVLDIDGIEVEAIVPKSSAEAMALSVGDSVVALIKASEVAVC
jgi:molybdate transport system regulatory protein